jgi:hypothetical protein
MKTLFIPAALLLALITLSINVNAQTNQVYTGPNGVLISVNAESDITLGKFKNSYNWMAGGEIQADIPLWKHTYVSINAGYSNYFDNSGQQISGTDMHLLPVMAGFRTFWVKGFYTEGISGAGFDLNKNSLDYNRSAAFIYVQEIGYLFRLRSNHYLDAAVSYTGSGRFEQGDDKSKINSLGIKIGYTFGAK